MSDLDAVFDGFANRERAALQSLTQRFSDEQFRDEVRRALENSELVDGENVGMVEDRSSPGFLLTEVWAPRKFRIAGYSAGARNLPNGGGIGVVTANCTSD